MKLAIGSDEAAYELKEYLKKHLESEHEFTDVGVYDKNPVLYPDIAIKAAEAVAEGRCERGILLCGTGIGMAMTANKVKGIRAAVCHDIFSTERSVLSNDAQILCMGARVIAQETALLLARHWLTLRFAGGNSAAKVNRISEYEQQNFK